MITINIKTVVKKYFPNYNIVSQKLVQQLWQGYGQILRIKLQDDQGSNKSIILKYICPPNDQGVSHQRKLQSYIVEQNFYKQYSEKLSENCRVPKFIASENLLNETFILLEDLDESGFDVRKSYIEVSQVKPLVKWLALFHKQFLNQNGDTLWDEGTYWYLSTRQEEFSIMNQNDPLKLNAQKLDLQLKQCKFQTILHGDAKIANFCFSNKEENVAAVDFQYCGRGVGVRDLAYLLGSCLTEKELESDAENLLNYYFQLLDEGKQVEEQWRKLWPICWADFERFLAGWSPSHKKRTGYSKKMTNLGLTIE